MEHVHLCLPDEAITAELVQLGKPHPEPYLKGAEVLGFRPEDCLVIEDTAAGIAAAKAAGMQAVGFTTTYPAHELKQADVVVHSCRDLRVETREDAEGEMELDIHFEYSTIDAR